MHSCTVCGKTLPLHQRDCVNGHANEYPNVRSAKQADEIVALAERVRIVREACKSAGTTAELDALSSASQATRAVMARNIKALDAFASTPNAMLTTYYKQVRSGARMPEDNYWDKRRETLDSAVNPYIYDEIHFAALSLSGRAPSWFGEYHVSLKEDAIKDRATVFEMNPFAFFKLHKIYLGDAVPPGYRAPWLERSLLVEAKLGETVRSGMTPDEYSNLVLDDKAGAPDADFIEVHIFGHIHLDAIDRIVAYPKRGERQIWSRIKKHLLPLGVTLEER